jgi:hypothetical protein
MMAAENKEKVCKLHAFYKLNHLYVIHTYLIRPVKLHSRSQNPDKQYNHKLLTNRHLEGVQTVPECWIERAEQNVRSAQNTFVHKKNLQNFFHGVIMSKHATH